MGRRNIPEVSAGSMADIAFLLLIFFLVTTTFEVDSGINRKLPPMPPPGQVPPIIKQKNLFTVLVNKNNDLLVEEELMQLKDLRQATIDFLDNGGGTNENGEPCNYCQGKKDETSSDHPNKAIISVRNDRETEYKTFISVQNELVGAYNFLRNRESMKINGKKYTTLDSLYNDPKLKDSPEKEALSKKLKKIQDMYPLKISEAENVKN
jgi:biopolymer transport protein TolR